MHDSIDWRSAITLLGRNAQENSKIVLEASWGTCRQIKSSRSFVYCLRALFFNPHHNKSPASIVRQRQEWHNRSTTPTSGGIHGRSWIETGGMIMMMIFDIFTTQCCGTASVMKRYRNECGECAPRHHLETATLSHVSLCMQHGQRSEFTFVNLSHSP